MLEVKKRTRSRTAMRRTVGGMLAAAMLASTGVMSPASAEEKVVTAVMHSGLRVLDPVLTTAHIVRDHAYMIYDVLIAQDHEFKPQPQMASWTVSDDKLVYTFTLRDGLKFHDGAPVTAADAVASLERWGKKDSGGQLIFDRTESLTAPDDKTIVWTLKETFPPFLDTLSKQSALPPFIMPKRVAETPIDTQITETIGSGPFKFVERVQQDRIVLERFADYWNADKIHFDKVTFLPIPDTTVRLANLRAGDLDMLERLAATDAASVKSDAELTYADAVSLGYQGITVNLNNGEKGDNPFGNDPKIRQAFSLSLDRDARIVGDRGRDGQRPRRVVLVQHDCFQVRPRRVKRACASRWAASHNTHIALDLLRRLQRHGLPAPARRPAGRPRHPTLAQGTAKRHGTPG